jgi:secondary thiamine-phosphate synthase enzyme
VSPAAVTITVRTSRREEMVDITGRVADALGRLGVEDGLVHVWVPHTTAGVTVNEGADPAVRRDLLLALAAIVPEDLAWEHDEGNSPAHVKTTLVGSSALVPVAGGRPALGRWQAVYLCEFDGPRSRTVRLAAGGGPSAAK